MSFVVDTLPRDGSVTARITDQAITIIGPWTVTIPKDEALHYLRTFQTNPKSGFYVDRQRVWVSHGVSRIFMTPREAANIVKMIRDSFGDP